MQKDGSNVWLKVLGFAFSAVFLALAGRLVFLQALQREPARGLVERVQPERLILPARRGKILDARGNEFALSQLGCHVKADPKVIGPYAPELAHFAAPLLGVSETNLVRLLTPTPRLVNRWVFATNHGLVTSNISAVPYIDRDVVVVSNLPPQQWEAFRAAIRKYQFADERQLRTARSNSLAEVKNTHHLPWYDIFARHSQKKQALVQFRDVKTRLELVFSNCNEVRLNGLTPIPAEQRIYPQGRFGGHMIGWTATGERLEKPGATAPLTGVSGIEKAFDKDLRGSPGLLETRVQGTHELVPLRGSDNEPVNGCDVRLTIDANLQSLCQEVLARHTEKLGALGMAAVMVKPATGEILALASYPDFDPNDRRLLKTNQLANRAINQPNEPGSTFKMVGYAAAFDQGKIHPGDSIFCENGAYTMHFGKSVRTIHDSREHAMGNASVEDAFAKSSNIAAVKVASQLDWETYIRYIKGFGYGTRAGVACGSEDPGYIQNWEPMTQSSLAMGYGIIVTPLQTAMAYSAIANGGVLMAPMLVHSVETADGAIIKQYEPKAIRRVVREETAHQMVKLMRGVVEHGTGAKASLQDIDVAGKTGTGRKYNRGHNGDGSYKYYATFVGFFPSEAPEICLVVTVDEPANRGTSYYAAQSAAPAFKEIAQQVVSYLAIQAPPKATASIAAEPNGTAGSP